MLAEGLDILSNWGMLLGDQYMWSIQDRHGQGVHRLSNHHRHDGGSYRKNTQSISACQALWIVMIRVFACCTFRSIIIQLG